MNASVLLMDRHLCDLIHHVTIFSFPRLQYAEKNVFPGCFFLEGCVLFWKQNHRGMFEPLNAKTQHFRKHHTLIVGWERTIFHNPTRPKLAHV